MSVHNITCCMYYSTIHVSVFMSPWGPLLLRKLIVLQLLKKIICLVCTMRALRFIHWTHPEPAESSLYTNTVFLVSIFMSPWGPLLLRKLIVLQLLKKIISLVCTTRAFRFIHWTYPEPAQSSLCTSTVFL